MNATEFVLSLFFSVKLAGNIYQVVDKGRVKWQNKTKKNTTDSCQLVDLLQLLQELDILTDVFVL